MSAELLGAIWLSVALLENYFHGHIARLFLKLVTQKNRIDRLESLQRLAHKVETGVSTPSILTSWTDQETIDMNRNGNSATFFSYVCNNKKIKELFAYYLLPIAYYLLVLVSSNIFVLNANFARLLAAPGNKKAGEKRRNPKRVPCFAS